MNKMKTYAVQRIVYIDWDDYQDTKIEVVEDDN